MKLMTKIGVAMGPGFWTSDWHLSFLLVILLLVIFVIYPLGHRGPILTIGLEALFTLMLVSGVLLVARNRVSRLLASLLAIGTAVSEWVRVCVRSEGLTDIDAGLRIAFFAMLTAVILMRVFGEGTINIHRIQGAVAAYLLIGVIWSFIYRLIISADPQAFTMPPAGDENTLMSKLVYFSFVTLTTVGYGDVTAVHPAARSLCLLEALLGQLFPAVLLARLVSMEVSHREKDRTAMPAAEMSAEASASEPADQRNIRGNKTTAG